MWRQNWEIRERSQHTTPLGQPTQIPPALAIPLGPGHFTRLPNEIVASLLLLTDADVHQSNVNLDAAARADVGGAAVLFGNVDGVRRVFVVLLM
jgi:hypothetical protein